MSDSEIQLRPRILIVDDEVAMVRSLEILFRPIADVVKAYSVPEAEEALRQIPKIDCIVTDVSMPEASGLDLLAAVQKKAPQIPVVVMTAYSTIPQAVEAMQRGAFEYISKPFENSELLATVKRAIAKKGIVSGETKKIPEGWICNSDAMKEFILRVEKLAVQNSPLLILGEMGTGKGKLARWLHDKNPQAARKILVTVDGRTHEEDSPLLLKPLGKDVGTLFIAEVFSLTERLQTKVLEILSDQRVRVLASTTSAPELQSSPAFRSDLLALLTAATIKVPSLQERTEDREALVQYKLGRLAKKLKLEKLELDPEAWERVKTQPFRGNIQEMESLLERAAVEARGQKISLAMLRFDSDLTPLLPFTIPIEDGWNRLQMLHESLERELILRALEKFPRVSNTQIAQVLGTTRRILELRMSEYRIRDES